MNSGNIQNQRESNMSNIEENNCRRYLYLQEMSSSSWYQ